MQVYVKGLGKLGITAGALRLPKGSAERATVALREQVGEPLSKVVIGGHSFGGRVSSLVAAEEAPAGLVLLSYPLHRPGHPEELRTQHWEKIGCPVLLLSGDRDPFAKIELLTESVKLLGDATLHIYPGLGHGLQSQAADVCRRIADFVSSLKK